MLQETVPDRPALTRHTSAFPNNGLRRVERGGVSSQSTPERWSERSPV
jgi:hypothetical protein